MVIIRIVLLLLSCLSPHVYVNSFTSTMTMSTNVGQKGTESTPLDKKKVAVFGGGGYLGATVFGFLQRASSFYGTGLGGSSTPLCIGATSTCAKELNQILYRSFSLSFAGEDLIRCTDMSNKESIESSVKGMDAVILGTEYQYEIRPVTFGTYEKSPNDKTLELYLGEKSGVTYQIVEKDKDYNLSLFRSCLEACKVKNVKHVVVIQKNAEKDLVQEFYNVLKDVNVPFTFILCAGELEKCKNYTFEGGIHGNLDINLIPTNENGTLDLGEMTKKELKKEDVAALAVQSLLSLDWTKSRVLSVAMDGILEESVPLKKVHREWCVKSGLLRDKLASIE